MSHDHRDPIGVPKSVGETPEISLLMPSHDNNADVMEMQDPPPLVGVHMENDTIGGGHMKFDLIQ